MRIIFGNMRPWAIRLFFVVIATTSCVGGQSFVGRWNGTANVENVWGHRKSFEVSVYIHPDGTVTGTVGKAKLVDGRFRRWRPAGIERKASGDMMDYMITGGVAGLVIPAEHITAKTVYIPIDVAGKTLDAGVNAHGAMRGTERMGIMSCDLTLQPAH